MSAPGNPLMPQAGAAPAAPATNALAPSQSLPPSGVPGGMGPGGAPVDMNDLLNHMHGIHNQDEAKYSKLKEALAQADAVRIQMDSLVKLGDMVTQDDLVQAASKLVGSGMSPALLAGILSDAPEGGEALKGWVAQQDQLFTQNELKLKQVLASTRQDLGVSALRLIGAHSMAASQGAGPSAQPPMAAPPGASPPPTSGAANDLLPQSEEPSQ